MFNVRIEFLLMLLYNISNSIGKTDIFWCHGNPTNIAFPDYILLESNPSKIAEVQLLCTTDSPLHICPIYVKLLVQGGLSVVHKSCILGILKWFDSNLKALENTWFLLTPKLKASIQKVKKYWVCQVFQFKFSVDSLGGITGCPCARCGTQLTNCSVQCSAVTLKYAFFFSILSPFVSLGYGYIRGSLPPNWNGAESLRFFHSCRI